MNSKISIWKDSTIVIFISLGISALCLPFHKILPNLLNLFVNQYASIAGYLFLCYLRGKLDIRHLGKVSLVVWAIMTPLYLLFYWTSLGTRFTLIGIVFGGLKSELISVTIGAFVFFAISKIQKSINIRNELAKPKGLKETTLMMAGLNIAGLVFFDPNNKYMGLQVSLFILLIAISYLTLWYYWQGNKWARLLVVAMSLLSLWNVTDIGQRSFLKSSIIVADAVLGIFLLWWLNTEPAKTYFGRTKEKPTTRG